MIKYTCEQLTSIALIKIQKILKKLKENNDIVIKIEFGPVNANENLAIFQGQPRNINASSITMTISDLHDIEPPRQMQKWNATLTITFIHEYSHFIIFRNMSIVEREKTNQKYNESAHYRHKDETDTWNLTIKLLKKLRYHRSTAIRNAMENFKLPKGFKVKW